MPKLGSWQAVSVSPWSCPPGGHSTILHVERQQGWKQEVCQPGAALPLLWGEGFPEEVQQGTELLPLGPHGDSSVSLEMLSIY